MRNRFKLIITTTALLATQAIHADEIKWNGYLNVVAGGLRNRPQNDSSDKQQHPGYFTYEKDPTFEPESTIALQMVKKIDKDWSVTVQVFGEGATNFSSHIQWAYATYKLNNKSTIRVGRIGMPVYYYSDFFHVGYSLPWTAPTRELYAFDTHLMGVDYVYLGNIGNWDWNFESFTGSFDERTDAAHAQNKTRNMINASVTGTYEGWLSLRAMVWQGKTKLTVDGFTPSALTTTALTAAAAQYHVPETVLEPYRADIEAEINDRFDLDIPVRYYAFNARIEFERWMVLAEWETLQTNSYWANNNYGWYVTGGLRFGKVLYHLTYAEAFSKLDPRVYRDAQATPADGTAHYLATLIDTNVVGVLAGNRHSLTAGVRIETSSNSALKFEVIGFEEKPNLPTETAGMGKNLLVRGALNVVF